MLTYMQQFDKYSEKHSNKHSDGHSDKDPVRHFDILTYNLTAIQLTDSRADVPIYILTDISTAIPADLPTDTLTNI